MQMNLVFWLLLGIISTAKKRKAKEIPGFVMENVGV
jgi:hypothetical protein